MKVANKIVDTFLTVMMILSAAILFTLTFVQVFARFVLSVPIPWSTDIIRLTFVYSIFFGAAYAAKRNEHLNLDVILSIMKPKLRLTVELGIFVIISAFMIFLFIIGTSFTLTSGGTQRLPYLSLPMAVMYISIPIGTALMAFYYIQLTYNAAKQLFAKSNKQETEGGK